MTFTMRKTSAFLPLMLLAGWACGAQISGVVFDDANKNGVQDSGEPGLPGIVVSTQENLTQTDANGKYTLDRSEQERVMPWVCLPPEYTTARDTKTKIPFFYKTVEEGKNAQDPVNFALRKRSETGDRFKIIVAADPQVGDMRQVDFYREDIISELVGTDADFFVTLGDLSGDKPNELIKPVADVTGLVGIDNRAVVGNHDRVVEATNPQESEAAFNAVFGPSFYSFNRGQAHFIFLNTVVFTGKGYGYKFGIDERQLSWIKKDLALVPKDKVIVLMMHAPLFGQQREAGVNVPKLLETLQGRNVLALGGHWHANNRYDLTEADGWKGPEWFVQQAIPAACGSFWCGPNDLRGIPVADNPDGTPNGYTIWEFDGNKPPKGTFKAASLPSENQMRVLTPDLLGGVNWTSGSMVVNYYFGYEKSKVEYSLNNGPWIEMARKEMSDPEVAQMIDGVQAHRWVPTLWVQPSKHIWATDSLENIENGLNSIRVRATEPDGRVISVGRAFKGFKKQ